MNGKTLRILLAVVLLGCIGVLIFIGTILFKNFSIASTLIYLGILLMFGAPALYYLGCVVASFCGYRTIGKIISSNHVGGNADSSGWNSVYAYTDKRGNQKFGLLHTGHRQPNATLFIRCFGLFKWVSQNAELSQEEYTRYTWSNIVTEDAEISSKNFIKKFWTVAITGFFLSVSLIIVGGILL